MKFHVNPKTGEAGKCSAAAGNCPFGGEEKHFTSIEAARADFEASQQTFSMPLKEMNAQAKTTNDRQIIKALIEKGSDRTLANLAKNPNLETEDAELMLEKLKNPVIRAALYNRKDLNLKYDSMTPDDLEEIVYRQDPRDSNPVMYPVDGTLAKVVRDSSLTEEHYDRVMKSPRVNAAIKKNFPAVLAHNNKIPASRTIEWLESNNWATYPLNADIALMSGKISEEDLKRAPEHFISHFSATGPSPRLSEREVDILARVGAERSERLAEMAAKDSRISSQALEDLVNRGIHSEEIYTNPKTPASAKKTIEDALPNEPFVRVTKLRERIGETAFNEIKKSVGGRELGRAYGETTITFDAAKVKEYGLTRDDIFYMAGARGYNAGIGYNEETGVFVGRVDSSD